MKNIQIIDGAANATYNIFQATDEEFSAIFPGPGQDIEVVEDFIKRIGEDKASRLLTPLWARPIHKRDVQGIQGTLFYNYAKYAKYLPESRREIDRASGQINESERALYAQLRAEEPSIVDKREHKNE